VHDDVIAMRRRMRAELDRSDAAAFDLKQGEGGLVDLEFLLQALVLANAQTHRELVGPRNTPELIGALHEMRVFDEATADALFLAHTTLLTRGLDCTLDRRPRRLPQDLAIGEARATIRTAAQSLGLDFT
jgi:glutamate-ammonia-ligase adenylyltransferase